MRQDFQVRALTRTDLAQGRAYLAAFVLQGVCLMAVVFLEPAHHPALLALVAVTLTYVALVIRTAERRARDLLDKERVSRAESEQRAHHLWRLQELSAGLALAPVPEDIAELGFREAVATLGQASALFYEALPEGGYRLLSSTGYAPGVLAAWSLLPADAVTPLLEAIRSGEPVSFGSLAERDEVYPGLQGLRPIQGEGVVLELPLLIEGRPFGGLSLVLHERDELDSEDQEFAVALGRQCALAVARSRLLEQRRQSELELQRSERDLADFFEQATIALHWVSADGRIVRANRRELELLGYERDEYVGRPIADFHVDGATIAEIFVRLRRGEALTDFPARLRAKDGSIREVLIDSNVSFEDGRFVHTRCFTRDVTEKKRAERLQAMQYVITGILAEQESLESAATPLLRALCESLDFTVAVLWALDDPSGAVPVWACHEVWSDPSRGVTAIETASRREPFPAGLALPGRVLTSGGPVWTEDVSRPDGLARASEARADGLRTGWAFPLVASGRILGVVELLSREQRAPDPELFRVLADVGSRIGLFVQRQIARNELRSESTERQRLFREAQAASEQKTRFLAAVSHDLRTPVHAIALNSERVRAEAERCGLPEDSALLTSARRLDVSAQAFGDLLTSLLEITSFDAGQKKLKEEVFRLTGLLEECVGALASAAGAKGLSLTVEMPDPGLGLRADRTEVRRVVSNLVSNAITFTEKGSVALRTEVLAEGLALVVIDTGPGIAEEHRPHVFDEFFQVRNPERDRTKGTGLGLAISRRIMEALGGSLRLESESGRGSTFSAVFPKGRLIADLVPGEGVGDGEAVDSPPKAVASGARILIIDDDEVASPALAAVLENEGYHVWLASGALAGIERVRNEPVDLVLLDMMMPDVDGLEVLARIRPMMGASCPRVLVVTGDLTFERVRAVRAAGADGLLPKPFRVVTLLETVRRILALPGGKDPGDAFFPPGTDTSPSIPRSSPRASVSPDAKELHAQ